MPTIYTPKGNHFFYDKFLMLCDLDNYLYVTYHPTKENEPNILFIKERQNYPNILNKIIKESNYFKYVVIDDNLFLHSNLQPPNFSMYKWPNGNTCKTLLKKLFKKPQNTSTFLVAQDDGTKSFLPPMYYGLRETKNIKYTKYGRGIIYTDNYIACSSSSFTRARYKFNIIDFDVGKVDYIFTPGYKNLNNKELFDWCYPKVEKGLIIFTKLTDHLELAPLMIHYAKDMYFYCYLKDKKTYEVENLTPKKQHRTELVPTLRGGHE